jgi:hypothetical protein
VLEFDLKKTLSGITLDIQVVDLPMTVATEQQQVLVGVQIFGKDSGLISRPIGTDPIDVSNFGQD